MIVEQEKLLKTAAFVSKDATISVENSRIVRLIESDEGQARLKKLASHLGLDKKYDDITVEIKETAG